MYWTKISLKKLKRKFSRAGKPKSKINKKFTRTHIGEKLKAEIDSKFSAQRANLQMYGILDSNSFLIMTVCRRPFSISLEQNKNYRNQIKNGVVTENSHSLNRYEKL